MTRAIDIVIPDAGLLISLAVVERLDLLETFGRLVMITDTVHRQCAEVEGLPGDAEFRERLRRRGSNEFETIETPFAAVYDQLRASAPPGSLQPQTREIGGASLDRTIANIERSTRRTRPAWC